MELIDYYRRNSIEGYSMRELESILADESPRDRVVYIDSEGCMQLENGTCIECVAKYYRLSNGRKVNGSKSNFALYCSKVRQMFGMNGWREEGDCKKCHLAAIHKKQSGTLIRA